MSMQTEPAGAHLPLQTPDAILSAGAIHDALARFYDSPTVSNKVAAVVALQAHLAAVELARERRRRIPLRPGSEVAAASADRSGTSPPVPPPRKRPADEVALRLVAAVLPQIIQRVLGLHAFAGDFQVECAPEGDDGAGDGPAGAVMLDAPHE